MLLLLQLYLHLSATARGWRLQQGNDWVTSAAAAAAADVYLIYVRELRVRTLQSNLHVRAVIQNPNISIFFHRPHETRTKLALDVTILSKTTVNKPYMVQCMLLMITGRMKHSENRNPRGQITAMDRVDLCRF